MDFLASNCKTYHVTFYKIGVMIIQCCAFGMLIGSYRAQATIVANEFIKNDQDLRNNPTEATIVLYGYCPGSTDLWRVDFRSDHLKLPFRFSFCVLIHVYRDLLLVGSQHPLNEITIHFR